MLDGVEVLCRIHLHSWCWRLHRMIVVWLDGWMKGWICNMSGWPGSQTPLLVENATATANAYPRVYTNVNLVSGPIPCAYNTNEREAADENED